MRPAARLASAADLDATLARLDTMSVAQLQDFHRQAFSEPTHSRHRIWLVRRIAWRLQAQREGGLSERALARADELSAGQQLRQRRPVGRPAGDGTAIKVVPMPLSRGPTLAPGTVLRREWRGAIHHVTVHPAGFEYAGRFHDSLSAIATAITGTKWNGLVFFGLKQSHGKSAKPQEGAA